MPQDNFAMHIGHVALRSPTPGLTATHLTESLGLSQTTSDDGQILMSVAGQHHGVQLIPGEAPGLDHIGLRVEDWRALDGLRDRVVAAGAKILSESTDEPGIEHVLRFVGPAGVAFEVYTTAPRDLTASLIPADGARKLGHVTLFSESAKELLEFLTTALNFRESDSFGSRVTWLRCDADHHGIAVSLAPQDRLHHYAFELQDWSAIGRYCDRLSGLGKRLTWGPGRHGPGLNLYTYTPDPDGAIVEAYADLMRIDDEANYRPVRWDKVDGALNLWGPESPEFFRDLGVPILSPH